MKKAILSFVILILILCISVVSYAQCSVCTRTAQQLGEKPATGLNQGILYLMVAPFAIIGFVGYRWWKRNSD